MADQPTNLRPWSTVDDEELKHLRAIAAIIMALQIGQGEVCDMPPALLRIALHEAIDSYASLLVDGVGADVITDFGFYLQRAAKKDEEIMAEPPAFVGSIEEFEKMLEDLDDEKLS